MGRPRKKRRQGHGSAWYWKQTDCWYYTLPGTKKRVALFDEEGQRIRGKENQQAAERALAKVKLANAREAAGGQPIDEQWLVARVCSEYLQYCARSLTAGKLSQSHRRSAISYLNDLCSYCGALPVAELKQGHIQEWIEVASGTDQPGTGSRRAAGITRPKAPNSGCRCWTKRASEFGASRTSKRPAWRWLA